MESKNGWMIYAIMIAMLSINIVVTMAVLNAVRPQAYSTFDRTAPELRPEPGTGCDMVFRDPYSIGANYGNK